MFALQSHRRTVLFTVALSGMLLAVGCAGSAGTAGSPRSSGEPDAITYLVGTWEGTFDIPYGLNEPIEDGGLKVVLNHHEEIWSGEVTFSSEEMSETYDLESVTPTSNGCIFQLSSQGADMVFTGVTAESEMKGIFEVLAGEQVVLEGTFTIRKKQG